MSLRGWLVLLTLVAGIGWWLSSPHGGAPAAAEGANNRCQLPPSVSPGNEPLQTSAPSSLAPFRLQAATLTPLAGFSVDARVLLRKDYGSGREAELSPTDLALGWGRMREDAVLSQLSISQGGRFYRYRWENAPPLPPDEIVRSSANMHMIPSDDAVAQALASVREGERVRIDGWLVEAQAPDGWHWRSSTTRSDSGGGACEVVYVCSIKRM